MTLKNNKGFTLIELIVVMVIIAILGSVGYNAFSNYTASANITKYEQAFSDGRNAISSKFAKSFQEGDVSFTVDSPDSTNGYFSGAIVGSAASPILAAALTAVPAAAKSITINGIKVPVVEVPTADALTVALPNATYTGATAVAAATATVSSWNDVVLVKENTDGTITGTYYHKITDNNVCKSNAFVEKLSTATMRYIGAGGNGCFIASGENELKLMSK